MNEYRKTVTAGKKEVSWTFWKVMPLIVLMLVIVSSIGFAMKSAGLIGSTMVEAAVFKHSFQYKEGMAQRAAIMEASIIEIDIRLQGNPENYQDLVNQKSILNAQLRAITINN